MIDRAREVREFWFGHLPMSAAALAERMRFWFGGDSETLQRERDETVRARFGALTEQASRGELAQWADSPRRRLSLIILLDQFPRQIYRGEPRAFATDGEALSLSLSGLQSGADATLDVVERIFFYMPMQHAESPEVQEESVAAFLRLLADSPAALRPALQGTLEYAQAHRELIQRFGRFPERNQALGRASTPEERAYLQNESE
jgi:uncharacterized protein (DUF924 family)